MIVTELDRARMRGIDLLVAGSWASATALLALGWLVGSERTGIVVLCALAANMLPTLFAVRRRIDPAVRLCVGTLAAIHPALAVYLLAGHDFQMDMHMYFFVALAGLTLMYDWRPLALASVLIAAHHLLLDWLAPGLVFNGQNSFARVLIHAVAVVLEFGVLTYLTLRLRELIEHQTKAARESNILASEAIAGQKHAEEAVQALRLAEGRATAERERREAVEREAAARRHDEMLATADAFQRSVSAIVTAVGTASNDLANLATTLNLLAVQASSDVSDVAASASQASDNAGKLARGVRELSESIAAIGSSVDAQARLTGEARGLSHSGHGAVRALNDQSTTISTFAETIYEIATRTNLLALNATIEAMRAGDVGRGFAVVATEVKGLAGQASSATSEIRTLAGAVIDGAGVADQALRKINGTMANLAEAAQTISLTIDEQRDSVDAIGHAADETAIGAVNMADRIAGIVSIASDTEQLSTRVSDAANSLHETASDLKRATDDFVARLRAA